MSQISDPSYSGLPFWASIAAPKFPLNADNIWLFFHVASYVCLMEKTGFPILLTGFMINLVIVATSHVALEFCFWSYLLLVIFPFVLPCIGLDVDCP